MQEIADWLSLPHLVRAEAYDISNTSGIESVGSMVVFENGRPKKNDYRKFKIKTVKGPDDYKSMREVLTRRFLRGKEQSEGFAVYPDIIMMDEPSLGLAPIVVKGVFDIIREINKQGKTILLVEQNANMALRAAHHGYVMETGTITLSGTGEELESNESVKAAYLGKNKKNNAVR